MKGVHEMNRIMPSVALPQKRKRRRSSAFNGARVLTCAIACILVGIVGIYCVASSTVVYPINSTLSCELGTIKIGLKTSEEVSKLVDQSIKNYTYEIQTQAGKNYTVPLTELASECDIEKIDSAIEDMKKSFFRTSYDTTIAPSVVLDDNKIQSFLDKTVKEQGEAVQSENAKIVYSEADQACIIQPEKQGNVMVENAGQILKQCLSSFPGGINLLDAGCYTKPTLLSNDPELQKQLVAQNNYAKEKITFQAGDSTVELSPDRYFDWLEIDNSGNVNVNSEKVGEFVGEIAAKYNTLGIGRSFTTSTGESVRLSEGDYGWMVNEVEMAELVKTKIKNQDAAPSDVIFAQHAQKMWDGASDFGNSYVEISIDNQELWMYVNGALIVQSGIVTGCVDNGNSTPRGIYSLEYKTRDAILKGEGYESPVSFWMPFNGGIGMHDATWREEFGGSIYQSNGSHGCVNLPYEKAQAIYNNLSESMPIIVW